MIKEVESNKYRIHWTLMKINIEVNNKHNKKDGKLKTILSIWSFKRKIFPGRRLMRQKAIICDHGGMQQWQVN